MSTGRSVANNWLLLALVSAVSFGGAVLYAVLEDETSPVFLGYFVVAAAAIAGTAFWWFGTHPPRRAAPAWAYGAVVALLIACGALLGMVPGTRALASWLTIGVCFALYGVLERSGVIVTTGLLTLVATVVVAAVDPPRLGLLLELLTGLFFALGAINVRRPALTEPGARGSATPS